MPTLIDDRGRLFGRVNVVDLLVVVALVALVGFAFLRFSNVGAEERTITTTFRVEHVRDATVFQIEPGDEVRDEAGVLLGTVQEVEAFPSIEEFPEEEVTDRTGSGGAGGEADQDEPSGDRQVGRMLPFESELFSDIDIVVEGSGQVSGDRVAIGPTPLDVGTNLVVDGPGYKVRATIWNVAVGD